MLSSLSQEMVRGSILPTSVLGTLGIQDGVVNETPVCVSSLNGDYAAHVRAYYAYAKEAGMSVVRRDDTWKPVQPVYECAPDDMVDGFNRAHARRYAIRALRERYADWRNMVDDMSSAALCFYLSDMRAGIATTTRLACQRAYGQLRRQEARNEQAYIRVQTLGYTMSDVHMYMPDDAPLLARALPLLAQGHSKKETAALCNVSRPTLYAALRALSAMHREHTPDRARDTIQTQCNTARTYTERPVQTYTAPTYTNGRVPHYMPCAVLPCLDWDTIIKRRAQDANDMAAYYRALCAPCVEYPTLAQVKDTAQEYRYGIMDKRSYTSYADGSGI